MPDKKRDPQIIGRREKINLPDLDLEGIEAKIDTGAYTSSLHCYDILEKNNVLEFFILDPEHPDYNDRKIEFKDYDKKNVKSSNGVTEYRYTIRTRIKIGHLNFKTDFTLTDRSEMKYPILIGRKTLRKRYLVNPAEKFLLQ